jgi:hypothetical protein
MKSGHTLIIPAKYQQDTLLRARYIEGWKDGRMGKPHAFPPGVAAENFIRHNGQPRLDAYSDGYLSGITPDD